MGISIAKLQQLQKQGKIKGFTVSAPAINSKTIPGKGDAGIRKMKAVLDKLGVLYVEEHRFATEIGRQWRFDLCDMERKIAYEYEGTRYGGSGHTSKEGYTKDTNKYNAAQRLGWRVFRYTYANVDQFESDLKEILCQNNPR